MKKILILASIFPPQKKGGGPAVSVFNLVKSIKKNYDIYIISHNHEIGDQKPLNGIKNGWNKYDYGKVYYFSYGKDKYIEIRKLIKEVQPDIIYSNSFFNFHYIIAALNFHKKNKHVKIIIAPRGELCKNALKIKAIKKHIFILFLKVFNLLKDTNWHVTSEKELYDLKSTLDVPSNKIYNIINFPGIKIKRYYPSTKKRDSLKMIYLSRIQKIKNLLQGLNYLKHLKGKIFLDIYGPIEEEDYWEKCKDVIEKLPENIVVEYKGFLEKNRIYDTMKGYDLFFLPTKSENFGHAIVEALISSLPVLISDQTPWTEINYNKAGFAIPVKDHQMFLEKINLFYHMDQEEHDLYKRNAFKFINKKIDCFVLKTNYRKMFDFLN